MTGTTSRPVRKHLEQRGQRGRTDLEKRGRMEGKRHFISKDIMVERTRLGK